MIKIIDNLSIISSFRAQSSTYRKIENRKSHAFIFKINGVTEYNFPNNKITLKENTVLFLPKGASYEYSTLESGLYVSINFQADIEEQAPCVYSLDDFYGKAFIFESFTEFWKFGSLPDKYKCISVFYDFLSYLARLEHLSSLDKNKHYIIEPAIDYLKSHLFDCHLKIDNLHRLCCVSDTYFRKLFISRFGVTPQEYVIGKRISHAMSILESGDYDSIAEVGELVGYKDPLYFSKAFKKIYGFSPSNINQ